LRDNLGLNKHILFLGKRNDVAKLLSIIDIFVLPSISEGMSLTLLEAMAASKAIVATNVGGNPEVISDKKTGLMVSSKDDEGLANAVLSFLNDRQKVSLFGEEARKRAYRLFNLKKMAESYYNLYRENYNYEIYL
jgi:glycosyltransferase involved in cell wall biosynthesis